MNYKRILVIKHGALGDLIQATGVLKDIRSAYPLAHITLLTGQSYVALMRSCPFVNEILVDNRSSILHITKLAKFAIELMRYQVDLVIDLQNSDRSHLYQHTLFRKSKWIGRPMHEPEPSSGLNGLIMLLQQTQIPTTFSASPDLTWLLKDIQPLLKQYAISEPYAVLIPGSSAKHPEKRWPHFAELASLIQQDGREVIAVLGPDEIELANQLPCKSLHGLSWQDLATLFKNASVVVGNDTGPSHIAAHIQAKGVALFGATTSAQRAEIQTHCFSAIQVANLHELKPDTVYSWLKT